QVKCPRHKPNQPERHPALPTPNRGFCAEAAVDNRLTLTILPPGLRQLRSAQAPPQGQPGPARATTRGYLWMAGAVSRPGGDTPLRKATASTERRAWRVNSGAMGAGGRGGRGSIRIQASSAGSIPITGTVLAIGKSLSTTSSAMVWKMLSTRDLRLAADE